MTFKWLGGNASNTIFGVIGTIIAILTLYTTNVPATMRISVLKNQSLLEFKPEANHNLELLLDGTAIKEPFITDIKIENSGLKAIRADSFNDLPKMGKGLLLSVEGSQILAADIKAMKPRNRPPIELKTKLESENGRKILIKPFSLNALDNVEIQLITSGESKSVTLAGYISDCNIQNPGSFSIPEVKDLPGMAFAAFQTSASILAWLWTLSAVFIAYYVGILFKKLARFFEPALEKKVADKVTSTERALEILGSNQELESLANELGVKKPDYEKLRSEVRKLVKTSIGGTAPISIDPEKALAVDKNSNETIQQELPGKRDSETEASTIVEGATKIEPLEGSK